MAMSELETFDLRHVVERLPRDIRDILTTNHNKLFLAGGFVRATVAGEEPSDIDLFGVDAESLTAIANDLYGRRDGSTLHTSENAITLLTPNRLPVQFITRWVFPHAKELVPSFDFTVCQSAIWRGGPNCNDAWLSLCSPRFYVDLAGKRLHYTSPVRDEEAGGSMLRVIKYVKRGYTIQVDSLGQVIARMTVNKPEHMPWESHFTEILREVDPLRVVDGLELSEEHHPRAEGGLCELPRYSDEIK